MEGLCEIEGDLSPKQRMVTAPAQEDFQRDPPISCDGGVMPWIFPCLSWDVDNL